MKFRVPLEKRYFKEDYPDDPYLCEGSIEIEAITAEAAVAAIKELMKWDAPGGTLQTIDPRIEWDVDWTERYDDLTYEDFSFGVPHGARATEVGD